MIDKRGKVWVWIVSILVILILVGALFVYFTLFPKSSQGKPIDLSGINKINVASVKLILQAMGAEDLHKNPMTGSKPVLCVVTDKQSYRAVVDNGLLVEQMNCNQSDLAIVSTDAELLDIISKPSLGSALKDSISSGRSQLVVGSSQTDLAVKGYLSLYNKLTS